MLNQSCLQDALIQYKNAFDEFQWKNEKYKWEAVKWFQDHWNANSPVPSPKKQTKNLGKKPNEKNDKYNIKLLNPTAFIPRFA